LDPGANIVKPFIYILTTNDKSGKVSNDKHWLILHKNLLQKRNTFTSDLSEFLDYFKLVEILI
jgi:hypothetical protein